MKDPLFVELEAGHVIFERFRTPPLFLLGKIQLILWPRYQIIFFCLPAFFSSFLFRYVR